MLTWIMNYWFLCLIAALIGLATGWWIWARARRPEAWAVMPAMGTAFPTAKPTAQPELEPVVVQPVVPEPVMPIISTPSPMPLTGVQVAVPPAKVPDMGQSAPRIAPAIGPADNLQLIKGVGPALDKLLIGLGVRRFDQIAAWTDADIAEVDVHLKTFSGRIVRDKWVEQADMLARGDKAGFEARYGKLGSEI